jgi:peptide/nickel transport system permease protein
LSLRVEDGDLVLRDASGAEHVRLPLHGASVNLALRRMRGAIEDLDPPGAFEVQAEAAVLDLPASGLGAALGDARVDLEPGFPATLAWGRAVPLPQRIGARLAAVARLDFGLDRAGRPIFGEIARRGARSLAYALPAFLVTTALALALALLCAARRGWLDRLLMTAAGLIMACSALALVPLLRRALTGELGLPLRPWSAPELPLLAAPALTWILIALWPELRLYRTLAVEESERGFLRAARARGLGERRLLWGHLAPNLAGPVLAHAGVTLPYLFLGSLLLERAYDVPGLGEYLADALAAHDARALEAATLAAAAAFLLTNALTGALATALDPRQRPSGPEAA